MFSRRKLAAGAAGLAGLVAIGVPLGLTSGSGRIDVFVGSTPTASATPTPDTYNVGVTTGTCDSTPTRLSTAVVAASIPAGSLACTFDQCWDVMVDGDHCFIKAGAYAEQAITGNRTAATTLKGEGDGDDVTVGTSTYQAGVGCTNVWSSLCADGNYLVVENLTTIVNDPGPAGGLEVGATHVTVRDFHSRGAVASNTPADVEGYYWASSIGVYNTNFTWDGGSLGRTDTYEEAHCYHSSVEPIWLQSGGDDAVIQYVSIGRYEAMTKSPTEANSVCQQEQTGEYNPHLEEVRFEDSDNEVFRGNTFNGPSDANSGYIFSSSDPDDITWVNNVFEDRVTLGNAWIQGTQGSGWQFLYNTILEDTGNALPGDAVVVGNFGYSLGCGATNILNAYSGSGSCGTNTYFGATAFGLDANNRVQAGSPAIDAAETPGASDHCTGAVVNSIDIDENPRPFGGSGPCTAGASEPIS